VYEDIVGYYTSPHQQSFAVYDPVKDLPYVKCPVLILFGQKDQHVTVHSNLPRIAEAIASSGKGNVTIHIQPDADHAFAAAGGMQTGKLAPGLTAKIACWLKSLN
jgi:dipeptidyl aminopeptidase/acylaminoacyl peptidase